MSNSIIVWDLETVRDLRGYAAANDMRASMDDEVREAIGDKFPKHIYHSIVYIGALVAHRDNGAWVVDALGVPHVGDRRLSGKESKATEHAAYWQGGNA